VIPPSTRAWSRSTRRYRRPEQIDEDVARSILEMTVATRGSIC
jgi:hypothetical protein